MSKLMDKFGHLQPSETLIFDLECFVEALRRASEDGSVVVSHGPTPGVKGWVLKVWHEDGSEEYLYPYVLEEVSHWLSILPRNAPDEDVA